MKQIYLKILPVLLSACLISGCDLQPLTNTNQKASITPYKRAYAAPVKNISIIPKQKTLTVWSKLANNAHIKTHHNNPRVQHFIKMYTKDKGRSLVTFSKQAKPYLYHVVSMLEERKMPNELSLLPIVESEYKPLATSNKGASGIWQLASLTGGLYGLKQDNWHDGRKDIDAATKAALSHLRYLHKRFDGDWLLALAAYNCGDARLARAIRKNKQLGKPTDYWSLSLPKETMNFVPKFLAITHLVRNSNKFGINLTPVINKPYFTNVKLSSPMDFNTAATLAKVDVNEIKRLNPAYHQHTTHPNGPHQILLPVKHAPIFKANLIAHKAQPKLTPKSNIKTYTVSTGDTLNRIAAKHSTSVREIKNKNKLKSDIIRTGQLLAI